MSPTTKAFTDLWVFANLPGFAAQRLLGQELYDQYRNQNILNPSAPILSRDVFRAVLGYESELPARGRYVFIHLILPHFPNVLRDDCSYDLDGGKTTPIAQARCANRLMQEMIDTLASLDRFDPSVVIFQSDHGSRYTVRDGKLAGVEHLGFFSPEWSQARSRALMLVKGPNAGGPFTRNGFPSAVVDTAPTVLSALGASIEGKDGVNLLAATEDFERERYYHFYNKQGANGWTEKMTRFRITDTGVEKVGEITLTNNPRP